MSSGTIAQREGGLNTPYGGSLVDLVVDEAARGRGAGEALVRAALQAAAAAGARTVDLTSRPTREAANRLYLRMGFEPRGTNVYRWSG